MDDKNHPRDLISRYLFLESFQIAQIRNPIREP